MFELGDNSGIFFENTKVSKRCAISASTRGVRFASVQHNLFEHVYGYVSWNIRRCVIRILLHHEEKTLVRYHGVHLHKSGQ